MRMSSDQKGSNMVAIGKEGGKQRREKRRGGKKRGKVRRKEGKDGRE